MNRSWLAMVPAVATLLCAPPAAAQTFALDENRPNVLWAEIQRPAFRGNRYLSAWLGFVGMRYQFASQLSVLAGLPFAQAELAAHDVGGTRVPEATSTALGNPYLGLRFGLPWQTVAVDAVIGLRVNKPSGPAYYFPGECWWYDDPWCTPGSASSPVAMAGVSGDYDRFESFDRAIPWSVRATALLSRKLSGSVSLHLRAGAVLLLGDGESRALADLGAAATYERRTTVASAGLTFRTEHAGQWSPLVQLALSVGRRIGQATPMVFVRLPLGGGSQTLARYVLGVGLTLRVGEPSSGL
jgi:hypothetical protein